MTGTRHISGTVDGKFLWTIRSSLYKYWLLLMTMCRGDCRSSSIVFVITLFQELFDPTMYNLSVLLTSNVTLPFAVGESLGC